jgi:hypothetical protein
VFVVIGTVVVPVGHNSFIFFILLCDLGNESQ